MSDVKPVGVDQRRRRRWRFVDCDFDEASWTLTVAGDRVAVETKPLELLRELLLADGDLLSKGELLDRIWPNVTVVEASLATAVHKLRLALRDEHRRPQIIETVPRIGYRLAVPVRTEEPEAAPVNPSCADAGGAPDPAAVDAVKGQHAPWAGPARLLWASAGVVLAAMIGASSTGVWNNVHASEVRAPYTQRQARDALRRLDVRAVEAMLAAGWDPNNTFDDQGNGAINYVLNQCEWDHGHNQEQILLMVRTLTDGGAVIDHRNYWGDTPYSIAKAPRYCGPDHPVTRYLRMLCTQGKRPLGDRCLASYELARRGRRT